MKFVIVAPSFNSTSGGAIVLHELASRLRILGHAALVWPVNKRLLHAGSGITDYKWAMDYALRHGKYFDCSPAMNSVASRSDLRDAIVIYPETVRGNPLRARRVVRWILNKPGAFGGFMGAQPDDLQFFFMEAFADRADRIGADGELRVTWTPPVYADAQDARSGTCYTVRKARGHIIPPEGAVAIDGYDHAQTANVFKSAEAFVSFDPYTRYSIYAAICGCFSMIVPREGMTVEQWSPRPEDRYGIAYGDDQAKWAWETRPLLVERLKGERVAEDRMVSEFASACWARFWG